MCSYNNLYFEDYNPEHYQSFQPDPTPSSNSDEPAGISLISHEGVRGKRRPLDNTYYNSNALGSSNLTDPYGHTSNMGPSSTRRYSSPGVSGPPPPDWPLNSGHHQAKRARVENIIRSMAGSPIRHVSVEASQDDEASSVNNMQGGKRAQACPQQLHHYNHLERSGAGASVSRGSPGNHSVRKEMHGRQMTVGELWGRSALEDDHASESEVEQSHLTWDDYHNNTSPQDTLTGPHNALETPSDHRTYQGWKELTLINYFKSKPDKVNKLMADLLKYELSQALSTRIDSIFKHMPLLHRPPNGNVGLLTDKLLHLQGERSCFCKGSTPSLSCPETTQAHVVPQVQSFQTDALSLVVRKSPPAKSHVANLLLPLARAHHHSKSPLSPLSCHFALHEDKALEKTPRNSPQHNSSLRFFQDGKPGGARHPKMDAVDLPWSSVQMRTKLNSTRSIRSPKTSMATDPKMIECAPHVKIDCDDLQGTVKNNVYVLNEGLTTNHLKKAKLMFFFTRYPSSLALKTFFHDVQFTRCITSQLIKWFSNFREFYYIQMEKHARHAFMEGVADVGGLTVGRESELFRALNMHYNKANDFQVPDRFLEVAEITVREFYIAIAMGNDSDPSWKKGIYKVICKLDSEIPSEFKSQCWL